MGEMHVYIVFSYSGEYEDYRRYAVRAFANEGDAHAYKLTAEEWRDSRLPQWQERMQRYLDDDTERVREPRPLKSPFDPHFDSDTTYCVQAVPFGAPTPAPGGRE